MLQAEKLWFYYRKQNMHFPGTKVLPFAFSIPIICQLLARTPWKRRKEQMPFESVWERLWYFHLHQSVFEHRDTQRWKMSLKAKGGFHAAHAALVLSRVRATSITGPLWQLWSKTEGSETLLYFFEDFFRLVFLFFGTFPSEGFTDKDSTGGTLGWNVMQSQVGVG